MSAALDDAAVAEFVERIRDERRAEGRCEHIAAPVVYALVDGVVAAQLPLWEGAP